MKAKLLCMVALFGSVYLSGCGQGSSVPSQMSTTQVPAPTPTSTTNLVSGVQFLSPIGATVGGPAFTLGIFGTNFVASSVVRWNGNDQPTAFINSSVITAQIPASAIASPGSSTVTVFNPAPGGGTSNSLTFTTTTGGISPTSIAVDPTGNFVYVANSGSNDIAMFTINATAGSLTMKGRIATKLSPASVAIEASGRFAYVANVDLFETGPGSVSTYSISPGTGSLMSIGSPAMADFGPHAVGIHPSGKFAYVANDGDFEVTGGSVSMYAVNPNSGALTSTGTIAAPCAPPPSPGSCAPFSVAVDPAGKFAYVANEGGYAPTSISVYSIDPTTGVLSSTGLVEAGGRAISVAVDPSGKFAYVVTAENSVSIYTINGNTGLLMSTGTVATGSSPVAVVVHPSGKFAYVTNSGSNNVSMYTINATTGALTSIGTIASGMGPGSIAIHPSGKFAYVTNSNSNDVSMYSVDVSTGTLALIGAIGA